MHSQLAHNLLGGGSGVQAQNEHEFKGEIKLAMGDEISNPLAPVTDWVGDRAKDVLIGLLGAGLYGLQQGWSAAQPLLVKAGAKFAAGCATANDFLVKYAKSGAKNVKNMPIALQNELNRFITRPDVKKMLAQAGVMQTNTGDDKPASSSQKRDESGFPVSASSTGGPKPDPKDNKPKKTAAQIKQEISARQDAQNQRVKDILEGKGENAPKTTKEAKNAGKPLRQKVDAQKAEITKTVNDIKNAEKSGLSQSSIDALKVHLRQQQTQLNQLMDDAHVINLGKWGKGEYQRSDKNYKSPQEFFKSNEIPANKAIEDITMSPEVPRPKGGGLRC
jgi:hypothetical protein